MRKSVLFVLLLFIGLLFTNSLQAQDSCEENDGLEISSTVERVLDMVLSEVLLEGTDRFPDFPGGAQGLRDFIQENIQYPERARRRGIQGTVLVTFVIDVDGSLMDVKVTQGVHRLLDAEAVRLIRAMPKWIPAIQDGRNVRVMFTLPINFRLRQQTNN